MPWKRIKKPIMLDFPPGDLCGRAYQGHKKGCPNFCNRNTCPPIAGIWDIDYPCEWWVVWNRFEFGRHVEKMRQKHPDWSQRQLECCLYWQKGARRDLHIEIRNFGIQETICTSQCSKEQFEAMCIPEAHGVNVTETMKLAGVDLEWPPKTYTYQVAVLCVVGDTVCYPASKRDGKILSPIGRIY